MYMYNFALFAFIEIILHANWNILGNLFILVIKESKEKIDRFRCTYIFALFAFTEIILHANWNIPGNLLILVIKESKEIMD